MLGNLILCLAMVAGSAALAQSAPEAGTVAQEESSAFGHIRFGVGAGVDLRLDRKVNSEISEGRGAGQIFGQAWFRKWAGQLEIGFEDNSSETGGIVVTSKTVNVGAWGRYAWLDWRKWRPFVSAGAGVNFDRVTSEFAGASSENNGRRAWLGAGGGVSVVFWNHLLVDQEFRLSLVRERKEPMISALLKVGYLFW